MGDVIDGKVLQVACVYGDFTEKLVDRLGQGAVRRPRCLRGRR